MTMLEATADANNRNAYDLAIEEYKKIMNSVAGNNFTLATTNTVLVNN
jgi:hypothetical protein